MVLAILQGFLFVIIRESKNSAERSANKLRDELSKAINDLSTHLTQNDERIAHNRERLGKIEQLVVDNDNWTHRNFHDIRNALTGEVKAEAILATKIEYMQNHDDKLETRVTKLEESSKNRQ